MPLCTKANTKPKCKGAFYLWIKRVHRPYAHPPQDEDEYEAYQELHGMEVPKE